MTTTGTLYVPAASLQAYRDDPYWGQAANILPIEDIIEISSINLSLSDFSIAENAEPITVTATIEPDDATDPNLVWSLLGEGIAEIIPVENTTLSVQIKPLSAGKVTLTASAQDGSDVSASCEITVVKLNADGIQIGSGNADDDWSSIMTDGATLRVGETLELSVRTDPEMDFPPLMTWSTSNSAIATVTADPDNSLNAILTGIAPGQTVLMLSTGSATVSAIVTVLPPLAKTLSISPSQLTLDDGAEETLTAEFTPADAEPNLSWTSSDAGTVSVVAGMTDLTATIFAHRPGTATITVKAADGSGLSASCTVTVVAIPVKQISLGIEDLTLDVKDGPMTLAVTIEPVDATLPELNWQSSDPTVATVSASGSLEATLTPLKAGTTTVSVSHADDASISDSALITVTDKSSIGDIFTDGTFEAGPVDIYDLSGRLLKRQASEDELQDLRPGIYIFRQGNTSKKILIQ